MALFMKNFFTSRSELEVEKSVLNKISISVCWFVLFGFIFLSKSEKEKIKSGYINRDSYKE
jgi:hypothetical protein